jgi:hypothetical protein
LTANPFLEVDRRHFGEHLAMLIVNTPEADLPNSMTILAAADPDARAIATRIVDARIVEPLAAWLGPPHARERAVAITMLGAGFVTHIRLLPLMGASPALDMEHPALRWLAASFQRIVDDPEGWSG